MMKIVTMIHDINLQRRISLHCQYGNPYTLDKETVLSAHACILLAATPDDPNLRLEDAV